MDGEGVTVATTSALVTVAEGLNERQRTYLLVAYERDQLRAASNQGPRSRPASEWRWIEYGAIGARQMDARGAGLLRETLEEAGFVDQGSGATWAALEERSLLTTKRANTGLIDARSRRPILSLMIRLTTDGRKVARVLRGEPLTRSGRDPGKPLSLSALRLLDYGQRHPGQEFDFHAPWGTCPLEYLAAIGICRGLVTRGLLSGEAPFNMTITPEGQALDVTQQPAWKPRRSIGAFAPDY